jgi:hypothetical protein
MLEHIKPESLLCIDIETVPEVKSIHELDAEMKLLYLKKSERLHQDAETEEEKYFNHAGIYAEFGKIICISLGIFHKEKKTAAISFRVKSFSGHDEKQLLTEFIAVLNKYYKDTTKFFFAGHNIREFDIPFICRRLLIHDLKLPAMLDISGRKPYDVHHVDTMQLWRFGDFKNFTSLKLLAHLLHIESPKQDIEGSDVAHVYWIENDLPRIVAYCERDVITIAQLIRKFKCLPLLSPEQIHLVQSD